MTVKDLVRPIPGIRRLALLRQQIKFVDSASFWEERYANGGWSGPGSYGTHAHGKALFLNSFIQDNDITSVMEFGCGDGNQLSLADYPAYVGLDVSRSAIQICKRRFAEDSTKSFFLYQSECFVDRGKHFTADLAISLDVVYHLIEDPLYNAYMTHLFDAGRRFVIIYSTNGDIYDGAPHVRHRRFSEWVSECRPEWHLSHRSDGPGSGPRRADFFVYSPGSDPTSALPSPR